MRLYSDRVTASGDSKQALKIGHLKHLAHLAPAADDMDVGFVSTQRIAQQQQHAERGAVHVVHGAEVQRVFCETAGLHFFEGLTKFVVEIEVEAANNGDHSLLPISTLSHFHGHAGCSFAVRGTVCRVIVATVCDEPFDRMAADRSRDIFNRTGSGILNMGELRHRCDGYIDLDIRSFSDQSHEPKNGIRHG